MSTSLNLNMCVSVCSGCNSLPASEAFREHLEIVASQNNIDYAVSKQALHKTVKIKLQTVASQSDLGNLCATSILTNF